MTPQELSNIAAILMNIDKDQLEDAGVMSRNQVGGCDWKRFNDDPLLFILKLPDDRREKLCGLINERL